MSPTEKREKSKGKREDRDEQEQKHIINLFLGIGRQYFGEWKDIFGKVSDKREAGKVRYPIEVMIFTGILLFLCQLGSRRQVNYKLRENESARRKYRALFGVEDVPHGDTLNYTYQQLNVEEVQEIECRMMEILMEQEELQKWRLFGQYYLIAMDGTGVS
jgi:hypothetical protein